MAKNDNVSTFKTEGISADELFETNVNNVIPVNLEGEMKQAFIDYAMSVITDRALPDVRDGLKPVHRRILYSMQTQSLTPDKPYRKSATVVGEVLGHYHPHGDSSVYDAMVRLAQDFSMRHTLVDGHGNFGSRDGDPAAAYRYTEARLTKLGVAMMESINKDTVDFKPNFDGHDMEPVVLPANFPNLLVNGSTGIAVGMATNIPAHNLGETINAAICLMKNPEASVSELMEHIKGPDFPTGGTILGTEGIKETYETGKGRIVVRAEAEIHAKDNGRQEIIVKSLPYAVNKARLIEKIAEYVKEGKIEGISNIRDDSARDEQVRIVIELKRDANAKLTLNQLYKYSKMQEAFNANMLALVPGQDGSYKPELLTLRTALQYFLYHNRDVITRRIKFDLEKALARQHIVEGLRIAIDFIDEVIRIIRSSANEVEAKERLQERFDFSERQAQHIVDMRLGRLTALEREKLEAEYEELSKRIAEFRELLSNEEKLTELRISELTEFKETFADDRRTVIDIYGIDGIADESLIKREDVVVVLTKFGYVKRTPISTYEVQHRGGIGVSGLSTREEDQVVDMFAVSTHDVLLVFTDKGRVFKLKGYDIPEGSRTARGTAIVNILQLEADEKVKKIINLPNDVADEDGYDMSGTLFFATERGYVKRTNLEDFRNINKTGIIAIKLEDYDHLLNVEYLPEEDHDVMLITKNGKGIRFDQNDVRIMGRSTRGVRGINLDNDDEVIAVVPLRNDNVELLFVTEKGFGKKTYAQEFRAQSRGGKGLICYKASERTGGLVKASELYDFLDVIIMNQAGLIIRIPSAEIPNLGRYATGVHLMRVVKDDVLTYALVLKSDENDEVEGTELEDDLKESEDLYEDPEMIDKYNLDLDEEDQDDYDDLDSDYEEDADDDYL